MSKTKKPVRIKIGTYKIEISYFKREILEGAEVIEQEIVEDVEIAMLARTSAAHTEFGVKLLENGADPAFDSQLPIAKRFCELMIVDKSQREMILNDSMACEEIFFSPEVQKDVERFLSGWGVFKKLVAPQMSENKNEDQGQMP